MKRVATIGGNSNHRTMIEVLRYNSDVQHFAREAHMMIDQGDAKRAGQAARLAYQTARDMVGTFGDIVEIDEITRTVQPFGTGAIGPVVTTDVFHADDSDDYMIRHYAFSISSGTYMLRLTDNGLENPEYSLIDPKGCILFEGSNFPALSDDQLSQEAARTILEWLTMRPGDVEAGFFADCNDVQIKFRDTDAEEMVNYVFRMIQEDAEHNWSDGSPTTEDEPMFYCVADIVRWYGLDGNATTKRNISILKRVLYKNTECGMFVYGVWTKEDSNGDNHAGHVYGMVIGSIVEGSDVGTEIYKLRFPFSVAKWNGYIDAIEVEADELWSLANSEEDDECFDADAV